ncbi:MAG: hypothetical protein ACE5KF_00620 [Kiloniellaceae bacterium]
MESPVGERRVGPSSCGVRRFARVLVVASLGIVLAACAETRPYLGSRELPERGGTLRVLLMPPDIELAQITAAGLVEPNAAWTATAKTNVEAALTAILAEKDARLVRYRPSSRNASFDEPHGQVIKLHGAVGRTILVHQYLPNMKLPTKKDRFDWSLGDGVAALKKSYDADYALFIYFRDSFSSGGRVAAMLVGALLGIGVPGGIQAGFASLVDLRSGDIVWFNRLVSERGDLRKPDLARDASEKLLSKVPL